jgi:hypothetical protein
MLTLPNQQPFFSINEADECQPTFKSWGLAMPKPTIVVVGGAGGMSEEQIDRTTKFFLNWIVPFADQHGIAIIDGGTDSGVMRATGLARKAINATLPLIGVVVRSIAEKEPQLLELNHSHFLLTPGNSWGDEAIWISKAATALSSGAPSATILVNGGMIAWDDARYSVESKRRVFVAENTGRTADVIASTSSGKAFDEKATKLIRSGLISIIDPLQKPETAFESIKKIFVH